MLRRFVRTRVVDRYRSLRRDAGNQALGAIGEYAGRWVAKEKTSNHAARSRDDRDGEIAANGKVCGRHVAGKRGISVTRIGQHIVATDHGLAAKCRAEQRRRPRMAEMLERLRNMILSAGELNLRLFFERAETRRELVLAFLSVLEIVRTSEIVLIQETTFGDIVARVNS